MEAADAPTESRSPRTLADISTKAPNELLPQKIDELSDAIGVVRHNLSTLIVGTITCQSHFLSSMTQNPIILPIVKAFFFY